jgi:hypothetical protein
VPAVVGSGEVRDRIVHQRGSSAVDVEPLENVRYLNDLPDFADTVPTSANPIKTPVG